LTIFWITLVNMFFAFPKDICQGQFRSLFALSQFWMDILGQAELS
jgi:hypothetical protein